MIDSGSYEIVRVMGVMVDNGSYELCGLVVVIGDRDIVKRYCELYVGPGEVPHGRGDRVRVNINYATLYPQL